MDTLHGIDEARLATLVDCFCAKVRTDAALLPVFAGALHDWPALFARWLALWADATAETLPPSDSKAA